MKMGDTIVIHGRRSASFQLAKQDGKRPFSMSLQRNNMRLYVIAM